jgi:hypothetical protein
VTVAATVSLLRTVMSLIWCCVSAAGADTSVTAVAPLVSVSTSSDEKAVSLMDT